jgi:hypothetical protein
MTSPFAATRVRAEWASPETYKKGPPDARLGLVAQPPPLLRSYFSDGQIPHPVSDAAD